MFVDVDFNPTEPKSVVGHTRQDLSRTKDLLTHLRLRSIFK
jgi:hypothetical protein